MNPLSSFLPFLDSLACYLVLPSLHLPITTGNPFHCLSISPSPSRLLAIIVFIVIVIIFTPSLLSSVASELFLHLIESSSSSSSLPRVFLWFSLEQSITTFLLWFFWTILILVILLLFLLSLFFPFLLYLLSFLSLRPFPHHHLRNLRFFFLPVIFIALPVSTPLFLCFLFLFNFFLQCFSNYPWVTFYRPLLHHFYYLLSFPSLVFFLLLVLFINEKNILLRFSHLFPWFPIQKWRKKRYSSAAEVKVMWGHEKES